MSSLSTVARLFALVILLGAACAGASRVDPDLEDAPDDKKPKDKVPVLKDGLDANDLNAEVNVLQALYSLDVTARQLAAIKKIAAKTKHPAAPKKGGKASAAYRKTLATLRDALASFDADTIETQYGKLDEIREKEDPMFESIELTSASRKEAPALLKMFSAKQVAHYLLGVSEFPDPIDKLFAAVKESRELRGSAWTDLRDETAYQVGYLLGGVDEKLEVAKAARAKEYLNKAFKLDETEYPKQRATLIREAREMLGTLGPTDIMKHFMERMLAEMLSSHRLPQCVDLIEKKRKKS